MNMPNDSTETGENSPKSGGSVAEAGSQTAELVARFLDEGLLACEDAKVTIEAKFDAEGRCPYNNDNYCRLLDWMGKARALVICLRPPK